MEDSLVTYAGHEVQEDLDIKKPLIMADQKTNGDEEYDIDDLIEFINKHTGDEKGDLATGVISVEQLLEQADNLVLDGKDKKQEESSLSEIPGFPTSTEERESHVTEVTRLLNLLSQWEDGKQLEDEEEDDESEEEDYEEDEDIEAKQAEESLKLERLSELESEFCQRLEAKFQDLLSETVTSVVSEHQSELTEKVGELETVISQVRREMSELELELEKIARLEENPMPVGLKIMIVGDEAVGKSCIIKRYCEKRFVARYLPTVGIDYGATKIYVDNRKVSVHIFDTSGSESFIGVRNDFYREVHGILLVFDVNNRSSFDCLSDLVLEARTELCSEGRDLENAVFYLVANKCDIDHSRREVDDVEAKLWAELHGFPYFETSANSGDGIHDMFQAFFYDLMKLMESGKGYMSPRLGRRQGGTLKRRERSTSIPLSPPTIEQMRVMSRLRNECDPWRQLGVPREAKPEEINKAYRRLATMLHPDKTQATGASDAFKVLCQARNYILRTIQ